MTGFCVWLTGLSGSGKTTLSLLLENELRQRGLRVEVLDGDVIRTTLSKGLGYTFEDRRINLLRITFVASLLIRNGVVVIVAAISPYQSVRQEIREQIGDLVEVFVNAPIEVCIQRDPKGLYVRAMAGQIPNFTGLDDPYDPPRCPDIIVPTHQESPQDSLVRIVRGLEILCRIPANPLEDLTQEETELVEKHLRDLGYL